MTQETHVSNDFTEWLLNSQDYQDELQHIEEVEQDLLLEVLLEEGN